MKKPAALVSLALLALLAFAAGRYTARPNHDNHTGAKRVRYYVDPMHPSYHSAKPGIAPDCGMALEPVYEGEATSNLQAPLESGGVALTVERQQLIGIRVALATTSTGQQTIRTTGRIVPDDNRL